MYAGDADFGRPPMPASFRRRHSVRQFSASGRHRGLRGGRTFYPAREPQCCRPLSWACTWGDLKERARPVLPQADPSLGRKRPKRAAIAALGGWGRGGAATACRTNKTIAINGSIERRESSDAPKGWRGPYQGLWRYSVRLWPPTRPVRFLSADCRNVRRHVARQGGQIDAQRQLEHNLSAKHFSRHRHTDDCPRGACDGPSVRPAGTMEVFQRASVGARLVPMIFSDLHLSG